MSPGNHKTHPWPEIAAASAVVIGVCQRRSGMWAYPTNQEDRGQIYSDRDSDEGRIRSSGFGHESITVTWNALTALRQLFPQFPQPAINKAINAINGCQDDVTGAFGTVVRTSGLTGQSEILGVTRHTAFAVLCNLFFRSPSQINWHRVDHAIDWLLKMQRPHLNGGWPLDEKEGRPVEPMSTAACVAALSCCLMGSHSLIAERTAEIEKAVRAGFVFLIDNISAATLWAIESENTNLKDNVLVAELLHQGLRRGKLQSLMPDAPRQLRAALEHILGAAIGTGWPAHWKNKEVCPATTVNVLCMAGEHSIDSSHIQRATEFIFNELLESDGSKDLTAWDWMKLGRLVSRSYTLTPAEARHALEMIRRFRQSEHSANPDQSVIQLLPSAARSSAAYILNRGQNPTMHVLPSPTIMSGARRTDKAAEHVFLSYFSEDQSEVAVVRDVLISNGEAVWWDQDILPGQHIESAIRQAMDSAYAIVVFLSAAGLAREISYVYPEIFGAIREFRKRSSPRPYLIPVRLSDCKVPRLVIAPEIDFDGIKYIDFFPREVCERNLPRLLQALKSARFRVDPSQSRDD